MYQGMEASILKGRDRKASPNPDATLLIDLEVEKQFRKPTSAHSKL
jgi:hypothetical protein